MSKSTGWTILAFLFFCVVFPVALLFPNNVVGAVASTLLILMVAAVFGFLLTVAIAAILGKKP